MSVRLASVFSAALCRGGLRPPWVLWPAGRLPAPLLLCSGPCGRGGVRFVGWIPDDLKCNPILSGSPTGRVDHFLHPGGIVTGAS
jgi:hypothetical protein